MSTVTQRIPNFLGGISQQPDYLKFPGQLVDCENAFPDYALGLLKRPGAKFNAELYNASTSGRWFSILRDESEKYVAQYDGNTFRVWSLLDGSPRAVNMGSNTGVPGTCNIVNLKTTLNNYNTAVALTATSLEALNTAQAVYAEALEGQSGNVVSLFEIDNNYPYGDLTQTVYSGVLYNTNGVATPYTVKDNGSLVGTYATTSFAAGYALGNDRSDDYPNLKRLGFLVYELEKTEAATHTAGQLATALANMTTAQSNYDSAVLDEATKKGLYDTEVSNCAITTVPSNAYLKDASAADIKLLTLNDYTFVLNTKKVPAMKATLSPAIPFQAFVFVNVVAYNSNYTITLDGNDYVHTTPTNVSGGTTDASTISTALAASINAGGIYTAEAIGPGVYISHSSAFTLKTRGSSSEQGLFGFIDRVSSIGKLPVQCKNGYKVEIYNTSDVAADNIWVEFVTTNGASSGPGVWEEAIAPNIEYEIDELTMPHQLVRQSDGSFTYGPVDWIDRLVGDDVTNPVPSFIENGNPINNIFFYRNRLGMLSGETVFMSRSGEYFNLFGETAQAVTDSDPIDVIASSTKPVTLSHVQTIAEGLVLFSQNEQFLLSTEATDTLTPRTANITRLASYECDPTLTPVSLGTTVSFGSKTTLYSKFFELVKPSTSAEPQIVNTSELISELIPSTVNHMIASPALQLLSVGETGSNTIYQYRFRESGRSRVNQTWYKWVLTGNLLEQFFDISTYYAVVYNGNKVSVSSYDLTQASEEGYLTLPSGERTDVCLDMFAINPYRTYNSAADETTVYLPYTHITGKTLSVVALGGFIGGSGAANEESVGAVLYPTVQGLAGANYVVLSGDYRGRDLILGYIYTMTVEVPKLFPGKEANDSWISDTRSDLIVQRIKVQTGLSGPVTYNVDITGREAWSNVVNVTLPSIYVLNNVNLSSENTHVVPIYQRNKNTRIRIIGDTPFPVTLRNLNWEGKYNTRYYTSI